MSNMLGAVDVYPISQCRELVRYYDLAGIKSYMVTRLFLSSSVK